MSAYLVLASPGSQIPDDRAVVLEDGFAWLAFVAPVIWLAVNRLWLAALVAALLTLSAFALAGSYAQPALALAVLLAIRVLAGLEGRNWRAAALECRGWRLVDLAEAEDPMTAFEIHAARVAAAASPAPSLGRAPKFPQATDRMADAHSGSIGLVPVERT
ncbi:DUF2628 domain-containing protein [Hoeflea olei]|uniref:DUF2628 domain-containing protein n=1 Tax=Hoeflea olei TaxID=1480615 RepID=A0A1C1YUV0_9HYPH|nr:DUF2628 domain-containing protein [Hoeflea olei]OCW57322.1 hypothetical protein AWJ14_15535 [Hoeflea olei]